MTDQISRIWVNSVCEDESNCSHKISIEEINSPDTLFLVVVKGSEIMRLMAATHATAMCISNPRHYDLCIKEEEQKHREKQPFEFETVRVIYTRHQRPRKIGKIVQKQVGVKIE